MDQQEPASKPAVNIPNPTIELLLKYLAGGVLFGSIIYFTYTGKIHSQTYLVYVSALLSAIGVNHLLKKN